MARFTYIYDTYCGWCYGASPVLHALVDSGAEVALMHRYLFQGANAHRMGDGFGKMAQVYDRRIASLTGQEFSEAYADNVLGQADEVLDSGLTALAAALVHDLGAGVELALASDLQTARFVNGVSAANTDHVIAILAKYGVNAPLDTAQNAAAAMSRDAQRLQDQVGASGVPVLLRHDENTVHPVNISSYYQTPGDISELVA